jgi:hypothetical protein
VSAALRHAARGPATPVRRLGGRFTGMVPMPSRLHVEGATAGAGAPPGAVWVRATTPDRRTALDAWIEPA